MWTQPTVSDFKAFFVRVFNYAPANSQSDLSMVVDADINNAMAEAMLVFNPSFYGDQSNTCFFYLAAFFMVENLKRSSKGIASQVNYPVSGKNVGGVSINYQIPEKYAKNAIVAQYTANGYGYKYLSLVLPFTIGAIYTAEASPSFQ